MTEAGTRFAILQRSLEIPDAEKLKRAFRWVNGLTDSDAHTLANEVFGILVNNLSPADAMTLQGALQAEGVETAIVYPSRHAFYEETTWMLWQMANAPKQGL